MVKKMQKNTIDRGYSIKTDKGYFIKLDAWNIHFDQRLTCADAWKTRKAANQIINSYDLSTVNPTLVEVYFDGLGYREID